MPESNAIIVEILQALWATDAFLRRREASLQERGRSSFRVTFDVYEKQGLLMEKYEGLGIGG
jgi:hypothetical protein